ncbi:hypothetical protein TBR22_A40180 [Luteitalea sp. TBR-22]|uniref:DUF4410 domain-containing protein n=1 Tax=Luteitalea sp. TBR-22 TaxID=2802971 RepID=UPI001AF067A7|nr:DUF4410 domain-containing protein [Luteitalea sp. TBR-22]BCS34792.1 hypothetical protein TBR22_A40180 [Luteitalea sp. TBR-22]
MPTRSLAVATLALAGSLVSAQAPVRVVEDGVLDRIELFVAAPEGAAGATVAIAPFDTSATDLGTGGKDGKQARQEEARTMQSEGPRVLAERFVAALKASGGFKDVVALKAGEAPPAGALVLSGRFLKLDPGSRAKRYFAGFGAGKSAVEVAGEVKDASGKTLATFQQRRIGSMGMGGGDSLGKLMSDSRSIGEDLARFMSAWATGGKLK